MPQQDKLQIFLSSALDAEVLDDRAAVEAAMKAHSGVELKSSDNFAASSQGPLVVSLDAVEKTDVYVGVYASRCGPITVAEYMLARELKKECLLFFRVDPPAGTPAKEKPSAVDNHLDEIRNDIKKNQGPLYKEYSDPLLLRALVGEAVTQLRERLNLFGPMMRIAGGVPLHLAKLCDRTPQETIVGDMVDKAREGTESKPRILVLGVPGPDNEDHNAFVDWYYRLRLREDYVAKGSASSLAADDNVSGALYPLDWPTEGATVEDRLRQLRKALAKAVAPQQPDRRIQSQQDFENLIVQSLNGARRDVTVRYHLTSSQIQSVDRDVLEQWLTFLLALPLSTPDCVVTVIFCFQQRQEKFLGFFSRKSPHLDACAKVIRQRNKESARVLPPLAPPKQDDAERWADTRCPMYHKALDTTVLLDEARNAFTNTRREAIPFSELRPVLEKALEKAYAAYHAKGSR